MTVAAAAELMCVSERAVQDWIEQGLISHESFPDGSPGIRVTDELHERSGPISTGFVMWDLHRGVDVASLVADSDGSAEERLIALGEIALDKASAGLAELTGEPWPAKPGEFPSGFPPFTARISDGALRMSYGGADRPILELRPIDVGSIRIDLH
jgi:hypothetical protein